MAGAQRTKVRAERRKSFTYKVQQKGDMSKRPLPCRKQEKGASWGYAWPCWRVLQIGGGRSGPRRSCCHLPPEGQTSERPKANKGYRRRVGGRRAVPVQAAGASERAAVITQGFSEFPAALPGHWWGPRCQAPAGLPRSATGPGWIASNLLQPTLSPRLQR